MATKKSRTSNKKTNFISKLGKIRIAVFVLVFAAIGAFVIYRGFAATTGASVYNVPSALYKGNKRYSVYALKTYIKETTNCPMPPGDVYDATTVECVKNFQRFFKLTVDGIVGPQTWSALFKVEAQIIDQKPEGGYYGTAPAILEAKKAFGGAFVRAKCGSDPNGTKFTHIKIDDYVNNVYGKYVRCGSDGTAYVGLTYPTLPSGQNVYEITQAYDTVTMYMRSWPTFVTITL